MSTPRSWYPFAQARSLSASATDIRSPCWCHRIGNTSCLEIGAEGLAGIGIASDAVKTVPGKMLGKLADCSTRIERRFPGLTNQQIEHRPLALGIVVGDSRP